MNGIAAPDLLALRIDLHFTGTQSNIVLNHNPGLFPLRVDKSHHPGTSRAGDLGVIDRRRGVALTCSRFDRVDGDLGAMPVADLVARLEKEIQEKRIRQVSTASAGLADSGARFAE